MTWPWQRLRPSDEIIRCKCDSAQPAAPIVTLYLAVKRKFLWWSWYEKIEAGGVMSCQECGATWAWGPQGRFKRGPEAFPRTDRPAPTQQAPRGEPPMDLRPIPKERP